MSIWAQIGDDRTTVLPTDGLVDIYAQFSFGDDVIKEGRATITFIAGTGSVAGDVFSKDDLAKAVVPIDGVEFIKATVPIENKIVRKTDGSLTVIPVAVATLKPIRSGLSGSILIAAYSTYDKYHTVDRFCVQGTNLTISSGEGIFLGSMQRYDPSADEWAIKASMNVGRSGAFAGRIGTKIYVVGGFANEFLDVLEEYDITTNVWQLKTPLVPLSAKRAFGCSVVYNDELYAIGGYNYNPKRSRPEVEKYNPTSNIWISLASLPIPLSFATAQVVGDYVYILYGASQFDEKEVPTVFNSGILRYSFLDNKWDFIDSIYGAGNGTAVTTTLSSAGNIGDKFLSISTGAALSQNGFLTLDRGALSEETVSYSTFSKGTAILSAPLTKVHAISANSVVQASMPRYRVSPNSYIDDTDIVVFNGLDPRTGLPNNKIERFDISINTSTIGSMTSGLARHKAGAAVVDSFCYITGGSAKKSNFLGLTEKADTSTDTFSAVAKPNDFRTGSSVVADESYVYVIGGQGSGHDSSWLSLSVVASPESVLADGKSSSAVTVNAVDAGGDPPPNGILVKLRGLIYLSQAEKPLTSQSSARNAPPTISILPVLFSALRFGLIDGEASATVLPRSEDVVNEVARLTELVKGNEVLLAQEDLKKKASKFNQIEQVIGEKRVLYDVAIEATISDHIYFGTSNSSLVIGAGRIPEEGSFFNPASSKEGLSASVEFYSDITSIPNVQSITNTPVDASSAKIVLDTLKKEIPFGASPHFDAIVYGAHQRIIDDVSPPINLIVSASDNENSNSANTSDNVIDEVNSVQGIQKIPVFVTTFVVTDPVSLSARKARTDVAELEDISTQTGGNSFSVVNESYIPFVIERIKTSAPSSIGSGTIMIPHQLDGSVYSIEYVVENMIEGNVATLILEHSTDGYNYETFDREIPPNTQFVFGSPIVSSCVRMTIKLQSKSFDSPVLRSVALRYIKPNVQYLFSYPQSVSGQITELAAVTNQRVPDGCLVEVGVTHGSSTMFDRDYLSMAQPSIKDRGIIIPTNRSFDAKIGAGLFQETLKSTNFVTYIASSGPWAQDAVIRVFVDQNEMVGDDFFKVPERGVIVFRQKLSPKNNVTMEIQNPSSFRVGLKITNPSLEAGKLDSFAFMYGNTENSDQFVPNNPPVATNLFISPSPVLPGGPLTANYTFVDRNSDPEEKTLTRIVWFRDNVPVVELNDKQTVSDKDLLSVRSDGVIRISRGQQWFFSVRPSDGKSYGPLVVSSPITIANNPPSIDNIRFRSNNLEPSIFTSSDRLIVDYDFFDKDGDLTGGDVLTWYVNGVVLKTGNDSFIDPTEKDKNGKNALAAGNNVKVEITPYDGQDYGTLVESGVTIILSTPPTVTDVSLLPTVPSLASTLKLTYGFSSVDNGVDQSPIAWFVNDVRVSDLDNSHIVPPKFLKPRQKWYSIVTPSDGASDGTPVQSNTVVIQL